MTERPTRRGFLAACSAAAAALGLTAKVGSVRPPTAADGFTHEDLKVIEEIRAELKPLGITVTRAGSGYTEVPFVVISRGGGSGATVTALVRTK
jgi:hypothetical protein